MVFPELPTQLPMVFFWQIQTSTPKPTQTQTQTQPTWGLKAKLFGMHGKWQNKKSLVDVSHDLVHHPSDSRCHEKNMCQGLNSLYWGISFHAAL